MPVCAVERTRYLQEHTHPLLVQRVSHLINQTVNGVFKAVPRHEAILAAIDRTFSLEIKLLRPVRQPDYRFAGALVSEV